jgi:DNA gyrase inhibitor GyrI
MVLVELTSGGAFIDLVPNDDPQVTNPEIVRSDECVVCAQKIVDRLELANKPRANSMFTVESN